MKKWKLPLVLLCVLALGVAAAASAALNRSGGSDGRSGSTQTSMAGMQMAGMTMPGMTMRGKGAAAKGLQLRLTLDRLLGEHAILAIQATQRGVVGGKDFPAIAKQLDRNSVALSAAISSVYGKAAGRQFLNGANLWRAHIKDFVAYTVATAKHDAAGQRKAVAALMTYVQTQATFFARATGLPKAALVSDLTAHVVQLKGQLDAYANGNYTRAYALTDQAYKHMFMTGDTLSAAIAKQKGLGSTTGKAANLQVTLDQLLGEHALLATWATQSGLNGDKGFPALAKQLDRNSVALSAAISSVYGKAAGRQFLNGANLWRAHIRDFVAYTVATARSDKAGQKKAVAALMTYIPTQAKFFAQAIGLPRQALVNDLTAHVLQLKGSLDAYRAKQYGNAFTLVDAAYKHMFMTGDVLAAGIAKQKHLA